MLFISKEVHDQNKLFASNLDPSLLKKKKRQGLTKVALTLLRLASYKSCCSNTQWLLGEGEVEVFYFAILQSPVDPST